MKIIERELYEVLISLQAEISALKELILKADPKLADSHQKRVEELRAQLVHAWRENLRGDQRKALNL